LNQDLNHPPGISQEGFVLKLVLTSSKATRRPSFPRSQSNSAASLPTQHLARFAEDWLLDGEFRLHSPNTVATRRVFIKNLLWFLEKQKTSLQSAN
jgi:hypothetical protein